MSANAVIEVSNLSYEITGSKILKDISFSSSEKRLGIVGRNGSGKTSLARLLCGLEKPSSGSVNIAGVNVTKDRKNAIRTVGIIFQNPDHQIIFPSVLEELSFGLIQLGLSKEEAGSKALEILNKFGKTHWAEAIIQQLSHGQKQLVCLFSILLMQPKLIILDEPFSGLDIPTRMQLSKYLARVDVSLIHISHDPTALENYERVIWLEEGKIESDGRADETLAAFVEQMEHIGKFNDLSLVTP